MGEDSQLNDLFLSVSEGGEDGRPVVVVAERGNQKFTDRGDSRYLIFQRGYRVEGVPGYADYQITQFEEYGTRLEPAEELSEATEIDAMTSAELLGSTKLEHRIALQWRLSIPIMLLVVAVLAIPLSRIDPRSGSYARILPAVILYFGYLVSLNAMRGALEAGTVPAAVTLLPVHVVFLALGLLLLFAEKINMLGRIGRRMALSGGNQ
jgi:lipopolysaccharide export system permease protein